VEPKGFHCKSAAVILLHQRDLVMKLPGWEKLAGIRNFCVNLGVTRN
jgi:hypothetical protein